MIRGVTESKVEQAALGWSVEHGPDRSARLAAGQESCIWPHGNLAISRTEKLRLPMSKTRFYPRYVERRLAGALEDSLVVLIHDPLPGIAIA